MQKQKQKKSKKEIEPKEQEVFRHDFCVEKIDELYDWIDDLIDDNCFLKEMVEKKKNSFIKGVIVATLIIGSLWILSLK